MLTDSLTLQLNGFRASGNMQENKFKHSNLGDSYISFDIIFLVNCNVEFSRQAMDFPIIQYNKRVHLLTTAKLSYS